MNLLPSFAAWQFAVAGLVCAAGPILIHLLNRRRYRVVQWAAMDFLREALQRNRRMIQIRDLLLLVLRTTAVLLFGLALAQPYFSRGEQSFQGLRPLHAVLLVDNSLSMGYQTLEGSLLDRAKQRARGFIERLPRGSRVTIVPLCGSESGFSPDPHDTQEQALEALERIAVVDRATSFQHVVNEAQRARQTLPEMAKRIVLLSDQQRVMWSDFASLVERRDVPEMQIVELAPPEWENSWVSALRVQDALADVETPTTIIAELQHRGLTTRRNVQVTLSVGGAEVASKVVDIEPSRGAREVSFEYVFRAHKPPAGNATFVPVQVTLAPDRLPLDDHRHLVVPVVASLPVVFVDQYGEQGEDPLANRLGETRHLRKLLAPTSSSDTARQLIQVRHRTIDQLDRDTLADARLAVIAGVRDPSSSVRLLREFVEQGGQLLIAAGAEFDAGRWSLAAWRDGAGILPAPLAEAPVGMLPGASRGVMRPFSIDFASLGYHPYFRLAGVPEDDLRELYAEPYFFQAIATKVDDGVVSRLLANELQRLSRPLPRAAKSPARDPGTAGTRGDQPDDESPAGWLLWDSPVRPRPNGELDDDPDQRSRQLEQWAAETVPRVLARFDDEQRTPFLVERKIGRGRAVFAASSMLSNWNTLPKTNAIVIFDRILRTMLESTLADRNYAPRDRIVLPLETSERDVRVTLQRPGPEQAAEALEVGYIGAEQRGVTVQWPLRRGLYRVAAALPSAANSPAANSVSGLGEIRFTVNGPPEESDLEPLDRSAFEQIAGSSGLHWVGPADAISLAGARIRGQDAWWWLVLAVLGVLLVEATILAFPNVFGARRASAADPAEPTAIYLQDASEA